MRKLRHYLKSMNYHVYFKRIRDVNNKYVGDIVGHQIVTSNDAFIESVITVKNVNNDFAILYLDNPK